MDKEHCGFSVLSIDIGTKNYALAHVRIPPGFAMPDHCLHFASVEETPNDFRKRAMVHFMKCPGWEILNWGIIDIRRDKELEKVEALKKELDIIVRTWFLPTTIASTLRSHEYKAEDAYETNAESKDIASESCIVDLTHEADEKTSGTHVIIPHPPPDVVCVEQQHNRQTEMRGISLATVMYFLTAANRTWSVTTLTGGPKLKVCTALGIGEGAGLLAVANRRSARKRARDADRADVVTEAPRVAQKTRERNAYKDRKQRSILATQQHLITNKHPQYARFHEASKKDDLSDALITGLYQLWHASGIAPKCPRRKKAGKAPTGAT